MKRLFALFVMVAGAAMLSMTMPYSNANDQDSNAPHMKFETTKHNFGTIYVGADGNFSFKFTNTGKEPLIIQGVRSSCGCTIAKKPNAPVIPGESSEIKVRYDTRRIGKFRKNITVTSNADNATVVLVIYGEVIQKPKEQAPVKEGNSFTPTAK